MVDIKVKLLNSNSKLPIKSYKHDACYDLYVDNNNYTIPACGKCIINTGIALEIPNGYFGKIYSRSGFAANEGIIAIGGVIDSTYRGEIKIILHNITNEDKFIKKHTRIAQLAIHEVIDCNFIQCSELSPSPRNNDGLGSTGDK